MVVSAVIAEIPANINFVNRNGLYKTHVTFEEAFELKVKFCHTSVCRKADFSIQIKSVERCKTMKFALLL